MHSQSYHWGRGGGGSKSDYGRCIATDQSGNVITAGAFQSGSITLGSATLNNAVASGSSFDIFIAKHDSLGNLLWAQSFGNTGYEDAFGIATDASNNIYLTGYFSSGSIAFGSFTLTNTTFTNYVYVVKISPSGTVLWAINGLGSYSYGYDLAVDVSGNVVIAGAFASPSLIFGTDTIVNTSGSSTANDFFLAKFNSSGALQWTKGATGNNVEHIYGLACDASGNIYITGDFTSPAFIVGSDTLHTVDSLSSADVFLIKLDAAGNYVWAESAGGLGADVGEKIAVDVSGDIYVIGTFTSDTMELGTIDLVNADTNHITQDIFLAKYSSSGAILWAKNFGKEFSDYGYDIATDQDSNIYITGDYKTGITFGPFTLPNSGIPASFITKLNPVGDLIWAKSLQASFSTGAGIALDQVNHVFATGNFAADSLFLDVDTIPGNGWTYADIYILKLGERDGVVWPGDTDNDSTVTNDDILPIGVYYGVNGNSRSTVDITWQADTCLQWGLDSYVGSDNFITDCNGDGLIAFDDTLAVNLNFSQVHAISAPPFGNVRSSFPELYFEPSAVSYNAGDWVEYSIMAGTTSDPVTAFYGLSFDIEYDEALVVPGTEFISYPNSFAGTSGTDLITIFKSDLASNFVYGGLSRIDHMISMGYGEIAKFKFQLKSTITSPDFFNLRISRFKANNNIGNGQWFYTIADSVPINPSTVSVESSEDLPYQCSVYPNPFSSQAIISFTHEQKSSLIQIMDVRGKLVRTEQFSGKKYILQKENLQSGIYFLNIIDNNGHSMNKKIIIH